jgi:hypothetical protein
MSQAACHVPRACLIVCRAPRHCKRAPPSRVLQDGTPHRQTSPAVMLHVRPAPFASAQRNFCVSRERSLLLLARRLATCVRRASSAWFKDPSMHRVAKIVLLVHLEFILVNPPPHAWLVRREPRIIKAALARLRIVLHASPEALPLFRPRWSALCVWLGIISLSPASIRASLVLSTHFHKPCRQRAISLVKLALTVR